MKIALNREYATRHLVVAAVFFGLALWFLYDAIFVYPNLPADGEHHTTVEFQYSFAVMMALASAYIACGVWRNSRATLEWDDEKLWGGEVGGRELAFADLAKVDARKWERKGILKCQARDGRRFALDSWHHQGAGELAEKILALAKAEGSTIELVEA